MKKVILVPALIGVMGIGGLIAVAGNNTINAEAESVNKSYVMDDESSNFKQVVKSTEQTSKPERLSAEAIEKKALEIVKDGIITELEFEREGKWSYFEVEVLTKEAEYELKLDAFTGELLEKEIDFHDDEDDYYEELYDDRYDD